MAVDIVIPQAGESVTTGVLSKWLKSDGDFVKRDEDVLELETDKVTMTIPAPSSGVIRCSVAVGETVNIGQVVGSIDDTVAAPVSASGGKPTAVPPKASAQTTEPKPASNGKSISTHTGTEDVRSTPLAKKLSEEHEVDLGSILGTGAGGRIREQDVQAIIDSRSRDARGADSRGGDSRSGDSRSGAVAVKTAQPVNSKVAFTPVTSPGGIRREKMSPFRQRVASRLVEAQNTAAMLTTFNECDMSEVMALRAQYKEGFEKKHGVGLGFMSFFVKACVHALKSFPTVNASIVQSAAGELEVEHHDSADIALAVGTPKGLVVPVLRRCEQLSFAQIEQGVKDLASKARDGKLTLADLQGGTFTITNGGIYGSLMSTPILNAPQTGILGMHAIKNRAVEFPAGSGQVGIRPMMYLALSYDHRLIDGSEAVQFLVAVKNAIEDPSRLLLGM